MTIAIDGNEANSPKKVGIGEYAFQLLQNFQKFQKKDVEYQIYLKERPLPFFPKEHSGWTYKIIGPKKFWTQFGLPFYLYTHFPRPSVFFTPTHYAPRFCPIPTVISVMDLSFIHFPNLFKKKDLYQLRGWTRYSVGNARKVFTISNSSKNDIMNVYHVPSEKIVVTYPGIKEKVQSDGAMEEIQHKYGLKGRYVLFVGTLQPRKNLIRLIEAFSLFLRRNPKLKMQLVIVGKRGWLYEPILQAPKKYGVKDCTLFLEFVKDEELSVLYKNAFCFVLPSLYEGFGLPVLEAMQYGCPVITSNVSSLPEAGGDAALYIDPRNANEISEQLQKLLEDNAAREELIEKGYKQTKKFSWEKTAKETLEVLKEVSKKQQ